VSNAPIACGRPGRSSNVDSPPPLPAHRMQQHCLAQQVHKCVHNLVIRLRGRPGDVNASDYTRKTLADWYLIALPHLAAHLVAVVREPNALGGCSWACDLVSVADAFMLTDGARCLGRLGRAAVRCKEDLCWPAARNDVRTNRGYEGTL